MPDGQTQKHRIAMVLASAFPSTVGSPVAAKEMAEALAQYGHEVHMVVYDHATQDIPIDPKLHVYRIPQLPLGKQRVPGPSWRKPIWDILLTWRLLQVVRRYKIDIIHAHNYEAPIAAYLVRALTKIPVIYQAHNTMKSELHTYYADKPWIQKYVQSFAAFLDRQIPPRADYIVTFTEEILSFLLQEDINPQKTVCIPFGIELAPFENQHSGILDSKYKLKGKYKVVYTGSINEYQDIDKLFEAFDLVHQQIPDSVLVLVGKISWRKNYAQFTHYLARDYVCFIDDLPFDKVINILADADVSVVPRIVCPGTPVKLLNYMASCNPIVAFEGSAKTLRHLENGLVIKNGDIVAFANGIIRLLQDPALASQLGVQARKTVELEFGWPAIAKRISAVYAQVLAGRSS